MNNSEDGWWLFLKLAQQCKSSQKLNELCQIFLTREERNDIGLRYKIIEELLKEQKPQREIAQELSVSISKVTRGSNCIKEMDGKLKKLLLEEML